MGELCFKFKQDRLTRYNQVQQMLHRRGLPCMPDGVG